MNKFQQVKNNHLALAQYHRWYQAYEVPLTKEVVANQGDILSDDVEISSVAGVTKGKEGLEERLMLFKGWKNAHHVQNTLVKQLENNELSLEADIIYENIRPDDSKYSYKIHYSTVLKQRENDLPVFTKVNLAPIGNIEEFKFNSAYGENRAKSFMHYWLYLMETIKDNKEKFSELLADDFTLNLSTAGVIRTVEGFDQWLEQAALQVKESAHFVENFSSVEKEDNTIEVSVDFNWEGVSMDGKRMIAKTHHNWILENNINERFARMKHMVVEAITPFQITTDNV